ncbi:tetratricopeptide repeat protein [Chloroflexota bacterium]
MNVILERLSTRKLDVLIALCFLAAIAGAIVYFFIFSEPNPGEFVEREIARLEKLVEQNPNDPNSRVGLALLYSEAGYQQQAIKQLKTALNLNDSHQGTLAALGDIYMELGHYEEAIEPYSKVVELNRDNQMRGVSKRLEGVYYYLGTAYFNLGRPKDAIQSFEEALTIDKTDADAWYMLGATYQHLQEYEKAIESFEQAVRFVPDFEEAYQGLASCYEATGQTNLAMYANAMVTFSSGFWDESIQQLEKVIVTTPGLAEAYLGLGMAYEKVREIENAIDAYKSALRLKPDMWLAQARLQSLAGE